MKIPLNAPAYTHILDDLMNSVLRQRFEDDFFLFKLKCTTENMDKFEVQELTGLHIGFMLFSHS